MAKAIHEGDRDTLHEHIKKGHVNEYIEGHQISSSRQVQSKWARGMEIDPMLVFAG